MSKNLHEFKKWITEQKELSDFFNVGMGKEDPNEKYVGSALRSKVGERKLLERIETEDDPETCVYEFIEDGGTLLAVEGKKVLVEVESGTFYVPRFCVKVQKTN